MAKTYNLPPPPEGEPNLGEGVSRPRPGARLRHYRMHVAFQQARPMAMIIAAENKKRAMFYARNRWPLAKSIEITEQIKLELP
jgi:hypothetical protein